MMTDTAAKRASATFMLVPSMAPAIFPDGTVTQENRTAASWMYNGILVVPAIQAIQAIVATIRIFAKLDVSAVIKLFPKIG